MVKIMSTTRILGTLLLTGTFALAATATQAQSIARLWSESGAAGLEERRTRQTGAAVGHRRRLVWHHRHRHQTTIHVPRRWNRLPLGDWRSQHQPRTSAAHADPWRLALPWQGAVRRDDVGHLLRHQHGPADSVHKGPP